MHFRELTLVHECFKALVLPLLYRSIRWTSRYYGLSNRSSTVEFVVITLVRATYYHGQLGFGHQPCLKQCLQRDGSLTLQKLSLMT